MNYTKWNTIAAGEDRNLKRIFELEMNKLYKIEYIRKTKTKYGDKVKVGLEGKLFCYLPVKLSEALLADNEAGMLEVDEEVKNATIGLQRLPQRGRLHPVAFVRLLPDDFQDE